MTTRTPAWHAGYIAGCDGGVPGMIPRDYTEKEREDWASGFIVGARDLREYVPIPPCDWPEAPERPVHGLAIGALLAVVMLLAWITVSILTSGVISVVMR